MRLWRSREEREIQARTDRLWTVAEEHLGRVAETVAGQLAADLAAREDQGWRKITQTVTGRDLSNAELQSLRQRCASLWTIDPAIGQAAFLLQSGTFGRGVPIPKAVDRRVGKILDRFWQDPDNVLAVFSREALALANTLLMVEGERFYTLHTSEADSRVKIAIIEPNEIQAVIPHPQNKLRPLLYKRVYKPEEWDFQRGSWSMTGTEKVEYYADWRVAAYIDPRIIDSISVEDWDPEVVKVMQGAGQALQSAVVYHLKANTIGQRGIPEVYRAYDWVKAHSAALSDLATLTAALAAFAWRQKVVTKSSTALANAAAKFNTPPPGAGGVVTENQNYTLEPIDVGTGSTSNQQVTVRHTLLQSIRPFGFGEHWYGDASTGNLATATAMELPAIWRIEDRQELFGGFLRDLSLFAIERAVIFQDFVKVPQSVDRYFDLDFPPARPQQPGEVAQMLQALTTASGALLDPQEASYQAYVALGTNDINQVMERQFPPQEKLEDEQAKQGDEETPPPGEEEQAQEAVRPFPGVSRGSG